MSMVERLAACLECRKSDLIGEVDVTEALSPMELHLIVKFRMLTAEQQNMVINVVDAAAGRM